MRPLAYGVPASDVALFWTAVVLWLVAPGWLVCRSLGVWSDDRAMRLGMGTALGLALQGLGYVGLKAAGLSGLFPLYPVLFVPLLFRTPAPVSPPAGTPAPRYLLALLALTTLAHEMMPLFSAVSFLPLSFDHLFHAGNTAELSHHWPVEDPRVIGNPFNYHYLSYTFPAALAEAAGMPVVRPVLVLFPGFCLALFALQLYNAGRMVLGDSGAGLAAAAVVLLHCDVGDAAGPWALRSFLDWGVYRSTSTLAGFVFLVSLLMAVHRWVQEGAAPRTSSALVLVLLSLCASGTKGSVMPVFLAGLGIVAGVLLLRRDPHGRRLTEALLVCGLASLPLTLVLTAGAGSFGRMLRVAPAAAIVQSDFFRAAWAALATPFAGVPALQVALFVLLALIWLGGYLGLAGTAAAMWLWRRRAELTPTDLLVVCVLAVGAALALTFESWGFSQLFFVYNGQVLLAIPAAAAILAVLRSPRRNWPATLAVAALAAPCVAVGLARTYDGVRHDLVTATQPAQPLIARYHEGLDWLRTTTPADSIVVVRHGSFVVSAYGERRTLYETGYFTARAHGLRWSGVFEAFPERVAAREALYARPDTALVRRVVGELADGADVYIVVDRLRQPTRGRLDFTIEPVPPGAIYPADVATLEFSNQAMHVYRVRPQAS